MDFEDLDRNAREGSFSLQSAPLRACCSHFSRAQQEGFLGRVRPGYDKTLYNEFQSSFFSIETINGLKMLFLQYGKHIDTFLPGHSST